jgi:hypothetical protein
MIHISILYVDTINNSKHFQKAQILNRIKKDFYFNLFWIFIMHKKLNPVIPIIVKEYVLLTKVEFKD